MAGAIKLITCLAIVNITVGCIFIAIVVAMYASLSARINSNNIRLLSTERAVGGVFYLYSGPLSFECAEDCSSILIQSSGFGYNASVPMGVYLIGWSLECYYQPALFDFGGIITITIVAGARSVKFEIGVSNNAYRGSGQFITETDNVYYSWTVPGKHFIDCNSNKWIIQL